MSSFKTNRPNASTGAGERQRYIDFGHPEHHPPFAKDNSVKTSRYSIFSFLPLAIREQFRRNGNIYFVVIGFIMFLGYYTPLFNSAVSPWTTLGPLALVVSVSLAQEGYTDLRRHRSDKLTNNHACIILSRADDLDESTGKGDRKRDPRINNGNDLNIRLNGEQISIAFESVARMNIHAGHIVFVRNREMIPADLVLLASSNDSGAAYVETSSIDGETNLKLRNSPQLPAPSGGRLLSSTCLFNGGSALVGFGDESQQESESIKHAVKRIADMSLLGHRDGVCALLNPANENELPDLESKASRRSPKGTFESIWRNIFGEKDSGEDNHRRVPPEEGVDVHYIATLTSEPPNTHVNNFNGKLTLPPNFRGGRCQHAPLNAENLLLRGAVLRNTEWVIGVACFTGADTKLVMNSVATPSKFSQLDILINKTVFLVLFIMIVCVCSLGGRAVTLNNQAFDTLWYVGYSDDTTERWPYFNLKGSESIGSPEWSDKPQNWFQYTFTFVTMLSNFVPLSLYVSVEMITVMMMIYISWDKHMYHEDTDTPASARSTIVTDLGLVEYIFSDKTGTLTCNVMEFKRCSVDGHVFGLPIAKSKVDEGADDATRQQLADSVHPLQNLLSGSASAAPLPTVTEADEGDEESQDGIDAFRGKLSFNAEMFLRVMSICHTVVVEKEHVGSTGKDNDDESSITSNTSSNSKKKQSKTATKRKKKKDGAPQGFAYQAESPDEGALVAAASNEYGFQLMGRTSAGVELSCRCPSLLENHTITEGIRGGLLTAKNLAAEGASPDKVSKYSCADAKSVYDEASPRRETWQILAVNKFDSNRKRMSVLVRSPPELGSIPMLLCKGADSSMLIEGVCEGADAVEGAIEKANSEDGEPGSADDCELNALLGIQAHLGEGLRTLVLGVRMLTEESTNKWLEEFKSASTSIEKRDDKLTQVALDIERNLHIVGATAIEDRLQDGVPETIANLERAGIKLWVLTGDKRETAIEIGYSTKVFTPKMHLTEVVDGPAEKVKTLVAMELMRHIKIGNLPEYQLLALNETKGFNVFSAKSFVNTIAMLGNMLSERWLVWRKLYLSKIKRVWLSKKKYADQLDLLNEKIAGQKRKADPRVQRRKVRQLAREIIKDFWNDPKNSQLHNDNETLVSDDPPAIFERAKSARESLRKRRGQEDPGAESALRELAMAKVTTSTDVLDVEALSMKSYRPSQQTTNFDRKKRTVWEKLFAVDSDVRHGRLGKHLKNEYKDALALDEREQTGRHQVESMIGTAEPTSHANMGHFDVSSVKRGLVVEGAALKHLLGDPILEEMLFAVASCCESVIACRVSPIQKALLLKMVRKYVAPTPTTLAIGDGANDVGMIQEAHIGIGISGLEGQQAVNASDFAIAQFRFLEPLLLIHGRWNFMRMSKAVLFFFYKNAALVGSIIVFSSRSLHSGNPLYDSWIIAVFNFVGASLPVVFMAIFDRDLPREYILQNPEVYKSGPCNEYLSVRMTLRWAFITIIQVLVIYHFSAPALQLGGGATSAFKGLMGNFDREVGDGEGGDMKVFGTTIYSQLIFVVTMKALYETKSLIHGEFPTFTCRRGKGEGWPHRLGYTWIGVSWFSIIFYIWFLYMYMLIGRRGVGTFFSFIYVTPHVLNMRSITWMVSILVPTIACILDVAGKLYSNLYYPTQSQIHAEIAAKEGTQKNPA